MTLITLLAQVTLSQLIIKTDNGFLTGRTDQTEDSIVYSYLGIPYVQPPIGKLRFQPPQSLTSPWSGVLNATQYKHSCPQQTPIKRVQSNTAESSISEDCLYINVFTTRPTSASNMSVMVWIHGGEFAFGTGATWQGQTLAAKEGIVVVTMNYRLGAFGFMTSGENDANARSIQANIGLLDQQMALKWVQNNIHQFGGNKEAVTLAGFSSGSYSALLHLIAPSSKGLFRYTIMQSGPILKHLTYNTLADARQAFKQFANRANCSGTLAIISQCLRQLTTAQIVLASRQYTTKDLANFGVVIDGQFLTENPIETLAHGRILNGQRLLIGTTLHDGYHDIPPRVNRSMFLSYIDRWFNRDNNKIKDAIITRYTNYKDMDSIPSNTYMLGQLLTDSTYVAPVDRIAQSYSRHSPTFCYIFSHRTSHTQYTPPYMGATHGMEIPYIFGYPIKKPSYYQANFTTVEISLSRSIMLMWGSFIRTG